MKIIIMSHVDRGGNISTWVDMIILDFIAFARSHRNLKRHVQCYMKLYQNEITPKDGCEE